MRLECSIEKIKNAIAAAERVTGKNLTLPILSAVLLIATEKTLKIRSTNLSVGIELDVPAVIEEEGVVAVRGDILNNFLSTISLGGNVVLSLKNDNLELTTKNHSMIIKSFPHDDFPTIPVVQGEQLEIPIKKIIEGLKSVYYSASLSDIKPEISSIYIYSDERDLVFVATDSFRLAEKKIKMKNIMESFSLLIPYKNVVEILRIVSELSDDTHLVFNKNQLSLSAPGLYITSRLIDGIFPDYRQIIPKERKTEVIVLKQELLNALKVSNIFADKFNQITLHADPSKKNFAIESKNTEVGENMTSVDAALTGEPIDVVINQKYITDCFQSINNDSVSLSFTDSNRAVVVQGVSDTSFTYLVMPMNR